MNAGARPWPSAAAGLAAFAACFFLLGQRSWLFFRSDDFAYVRSMLGAWERGGLYTYEWLAPYGATLTGLSLLGWRLTGNFPFAIFALLAVSALAAYVLLFRLLARRLPSAPAALIALVFATSPLFFAKATDVHGAVPTLALFLAALSAYEAGWAGLAAAFALLAFANRQSHAVFFLLFAWEALRGGWHGRPSRPWLVWGAAFAACASGLGLFMNTTAAQLHALLPSGGSLEQARAFARALAAAIFLALGLLSLFCLLLRPLRPLLAENLRHWKFPAAASLLLVAMAFFWPPDLLRFDTPLFGLATWAQANRALPWLILPLLWILDYRLLKPSPYLGLAAGFLLITSLRGILWDYYFLEVIVLCLLLVSGRAAEAAETPTPAWKIVLPVLLAAQLAYAYVLRVESGRQAAAVAALERLERQGRLRVDLMSGAPFGHLGWKLLDHYLKQDEPKARADLAGFTGYVRPGRVFVETHVPWRRSFRVALPPEAEMLDSGTTRIGYLSLPYRVVDYHRRGSEPVLALDYSRYRPQPFPLGGKEWNRLLDSLGRDR